MIPEPTRWEGDRTEFMADVHDLEHIARTVCAFLNSRGGTLFCGVDATCQPIGMDNVSDYLQRIHAHLLNVITPKALFTVNVDDEAGKSMIVIEVPVGRDCPYSCSGIVYVRRGSSTQRIETDVLRGMLQSAAVEVVRWERRPSMAMEENDLDQAEIDRLVQMARKSGRFEFSDVTDNLSVLKALAVYSARGFTQAADVLFATNPALRHPQTRVRVTRFASDKGGDIYLDNRSLQGALVKVFDQVFDIVKQHIRWESTFPSGEVRRTDMPEYPLAALREGLVNAFAHRDYAGSSGGISVGIYPSRIEIWNSGHFPEGITPDCLGEQHASLPTNPDIAHVLYIHNLMERLGRGSQMIINLCREYNLRQPTWVDKPDGITLTLFGRIGHQAGLMTDSRSHRRSSQTDPLVDLTPWLASLLDRTDTLEIRGIGSGAGRQREASKHPIEQLYTPLRSQGGLDKREEREEQKTVSLAELLPRHPRLLIEGQPGAGKTTFLKMVAAMLAKDLLKIPNPQGSHWRAQYLGMQEAARYPLFLRLSELAILLAADPKTIRDDRHRLLALLGGDREADWLTLLEAGQAILLLDGLDEVTGDALRRRVILIVQDAVRNWPHCPVLVTSRPFGVGQMKGLDFQHVRIEPFGKKEIHTFIDRWSAALHAGLDGGRDSLSAAKHREILLHAIMNRPAIRQLATNPVMLTCLCVVHWNEGNLPEGRARVYQAVIRWLISARSEMRRYAGYTDTFAEEAFATLALAMMEKGRSGTQAVFDPEEGAEAVLSLVLEHFSLITTKPRRLAWARKWLDFECQGSGIVEEVGERRLEFWHLTFQEFLAALALAGMGDGEVKGEDWWPRIEPVLGNPRWRETVALLPGTLLDKGGRRRVDRLLERVLAMGGEKPDLPVNARIAGIMGRLLEPMSAYQYPVPQGVEQSYQAVLQHSLDIFTQDGAQRVSLAIRLEAAEALGRQGDPRLQQRNWIKVPGTGGWLLGKYLVTVAEYQAFVEQEGYQDQRWWCAAGWTIRLKENWENPENWDDQTRHPNHPVTWVSWFEAMAYCRWLCDREKRMIRLPVEILWAKAATPSKGAYPWGEVEPTPELANFGGNVHSSTPVGLYPAGDGPLGHCDLAGNVWEWQRNLYQDEDATMDMPPDPVVAGADEMAVRGGSWLNPAGNLRAACLSGFPAEGRYVGLGFRVAVAPSSTLDL